MGRALRVTKARRHAGAMARIEEMRYALPLNLYLEVLHRAAATGQLATYDSQGNMTGLRPITPKEQMDTAKYLVDKIMPSHANMRSDHDETPDAEDAITKLSHMTEAQLRELVYQEDVSKEADVILFPGEVVEPDGD